MGDGRKRVESFLKGCLGEGGFEALNKAIVRIGPDVVADPQDLYLPLLVVPRSLLAWLVANVRSMKDGEAKDMEIPGTGGAHMNVNKVLSDVYKGTVYKGGKEMHRFDRVCLPALAGHLMTIFELYDDFLPAKDEPKEKGKDKGKDKEKPEAEPAQALDRALSGRLGELITRMVLASQTPAAAPAINITINNGEAKAAEKAPEPKPEAPVKKEEPSATAASKPPQPPKAPAAPAAAAAAPPAPPQPAKTPPAAPAPKAPAAVGKSFALDDDDLAATCPDCGENEFDEAGNYAGCPCFSYMTKSSVSVENVGGKKLIKFGKAWSRENIEAFLRNLRAWRDGME